jgi:CheY-like chemotaxis protein
VRLLIADDNAAVRKIIRELCQSLAEDVEECDNGQRALEAFSRLRADIVLMDMRMPQMDGLEATRAILKLDANAKVLIVTEYDDDLLRAEAFRAGAIGYETKENLLLLPEAVRALALKPNIGT